MINLIHCKRSSQIDNGCPQKSIDKYLNVFQMTTVNDEFETSGLRIRNVLEYYSNSKLATLMGAKRRKNYE